MKKFILTLVYIGISFAHADDRVEKIFNEQLKSHKISREDVGAIISAGEGGKTQMLLSHRADKKMTPASVTKVLTTSAVLDTFLPGTKLKTHLLLDEKPRGTVAKGPIYLKGGGDPSFVSENMWFLVNAFRRSGVDSVEGDVIVDDTLFDNVRYDESRESTRVDRAYDAPVGAMSFNWNSINVFVRPAAKGEKAKVFLDPDNVFTRLENKIKTVGGDKFSIDVHRATLGTQDVLTVEGSIGENVSEHVIYKNITRPDLWSGFNLKAFMAQRGIQIKGDVRTGKTPASAYVAAEVESKPIEDILVDMNKFSNNFVAEMLCKNLGLKKKQPATIEAGMTVIREHLQSLGIQSKDYELYNPSGLTRENKFTAEVLWKVLKHLKEDFRLQPEFFRSLPIAGIDGTLKKRMRASGAEREVRAKTGMLNGVVALSGFAGQKDGTPLTFAFIYNGSQDEAKVRQFYDDLLIELVK